MATAMLDADAVRSVCDLRSLQILKTVLVGGQSFVAQPNQQLIIARFMLPHPVRAESPVGISRELRSDLVDCLKKAP